MSDVKPDLALSPPPVHAGEAVIADTLKNPQTVHINMLRGGIAKPTPASIGHLYRGAEAVEVVSEVMRQNPDAFDHPSSGEDVEGLREARDTAQSAVEAWAGVVESLEAHLQDRVAMRDEAKPERYLSILRSNIANVQRDSKQIRAARWADRARLVARIEELEQAAVSIRSQS